MEYNKLYDIFNKIKTNENIDKILNEIFNEFDKIFLNNSNFIDYDILIQLIYEHLDSTDFVINFLNIFIIKYNFIKKIIFVELSHKFKNNDIEKIKNLLLLDMISFEYIYILLKSIQFDVEITKNIIYWLLYIGKTNNVYDIIDYIFENTTNIQNLINFTISIITCYLDIKLILDKNITTNINFKIIKFLHIKILPLYDQKLLFDSFTSALNQNIILNNNTFNMLTNNLDFIEILINFYSICINNLSNVYIPNVDDNTIINDILYFYNILIDDIQNENIITKKNDFLDLLPDLLSNNNDIINMHSRVLILLKMKTILLSKRSLNNNLYIPKNLGMSLINFLSTVKFLSWSFEEEIYMIYETIFKLLFLTVKKNNLLNYDKNYNMNIDDIIFYLLSHQKELFDLIKKLLNSDINFTNYMLLNEKIYGYCNILGISTYIEKYLYLSDKCNKIPLELSYKFNLILDELLTYILNSHNHNFIDNKYIHIIIRNKILFIDKYIQSDSFYYYGLTYENLFEYCDNEHNTNIMSNIMFNNMFNNLFNIKEKLFEYKLFLDKSNERIENNDKNNTILIDPIFSIEIVTPCMIPYSNELYEEITMKLLCRETQKNPITREKLTLDDLITYNNKENIKCKKIKYNI